MSKEAILKSVQEAVVRDIRNKSLSEMPQTDYTQSRESQIKGPVTVDIRVDSQVSDGIIGVVGQFPNIQAAIQACNTIEKAMGVDPSQEYGPFCAITDSSGQTYICSQGFVEPF